MNKNNRKPFICIVVPVYNVEPYVEDCIRSVMRQTYNGTIECIIVDDCGSDNSMAIVEKMVTEYNGPITFKILHHEHNRGLSAARNTGMDAATGDYLFFLDSDDELTDDCINKLVEPLKTESYDFIIGSLQTINKIGEIIPTKLKIYVPNNTILKQPDLLQTYQKGYWLVAAWNKLYSLDFIRKHQLRFFEGIIHEDVLWSFQIVCLASSLYVVNQTTYLYRRRKGSIMKTADKYTKANAYSINVREMGLFVKEKGIYNDNIHELIQKVFYFALYYSHRPFSEFCCLYGQMRQYAKPSIRNLLISNKVHLCRYSRDFHYLLPPTLAPYWEWIFVCFRLLIKRIIWIIH